MLVETTLQRLDDLIASKSILTHPFYVAWQKGELTRDDLRTYATTYFPHVAAFPGYLESAIDITEDAEVRDELQQNLHDENHQPAPHPQLWLDFAQGMGADREGVESAETQPAAQQVVSTFDRLCRRGTGEALAALYAYESQQPEVARTKSDGLAEWYGVTDAKTRDYFEVHAEADIEHRAGERAALGRCIQTPDDADRVLAAADEALDSYWGLLDGISDQIGLADRCEARD
jgi:pyrroloquinoline-quinone synthase